MAREGAKRICGWRLVQSKLTSFLFDFIARRNIRLIMRVSKATIAIEAHSTEPWTAHAVKSDGTLGTKYIFERPTRKKYS